MKSLKTTLKNLRRSPYQSLSAFAMTTITFFVVTIFAILIYTTQNLLSYFETRPQVTAFFKDQVTDEEVESIKNKLVETGLVKDMLYVSKEDALAIYKAQNKDNTLLLEMVTADILPASLEVSGKNVKDLEEISKVIKADAIVEEVVFQKDVADTLEKWVNGIRIGGLAIVSLLLVGSFVTMVVILGMRVATKRGEIKTLALLGASSWYIRKPFIIEGLLYVVVGAMLGWGSACVMILYLTPNLLEFFSGMNVFPIPYTIALSSLGIETIIALLLGIFASLSATKRYGR